MVWGDGPGLGLPPPMQCAIARRAPNRTCAWHMAKVVEQAGRTCFRMASGLLSVAGSKSVSVIVWIFGFGISNLISGARI